MHRPIKHIAMNIGITLFLVISILISTNANSEQSAEDIIKNKLIPIYFTICLIKLCILKTP